MALNKLYVCRSCGNIAAKVKDAHTPLSCCGEEMQEIIAGTTDAAVEKHLPAVCPEGDLLKVTVGSVEHPMLENHYIEWISLETTLGSRIKYLKPGEKPEALFVLGGEKPLSVSAYCNLHGLWETAL